MEMPTWSKWVLGVVVVVAATVAADWLAGFFFVLFSKTNPLGKTDFTTWYEYWYWYSGNADIGKRLNVAAITAALVSYGIPLALVIAANRKSRALYGEARFATASEINASGLTGSDGIIVGKYKNRFLVFTGQQFVLLAAPTRSGKGVGVVIPNLLTFKDSVVVLDVKQENYNLTAGFRQKHGQDVFLFNPFAEDYRTCRYNPLGYVRDGDFRVGDLTAIGEVFYPSGGNSKDSFFDDQARNLFIGLGLYLCETPSLPRTIGEMLRQSSGKGQPIRDYIQELVEQRNYEQKESLDEATGEVQYELVPKEWNGEGLPPLSGECVDALNRFTSTSDNTLSSILASFNAPLGIWMNPIVDAATSANDFDLREVRKKRMSIYIGITPDHLAEAGRLVNLLFSQLINLNTKEQPQDNPTLKYQCLLLMDEFTAIGRVGIIGKAVSYMAGYNLRLLTIIQSPAQVEDEAPHGYGRHGARTLITNHACQILYAPREQEDAEAYSKQLGTQTVDGTSVSKQRGRGHPSETTSDQRRELLLPQEIKAIGEWKEIIMLENTKPILCDKIKFFADKTFVERLKSISPSLSAISKMPSKDDYDNAVRLDELAPEPALLDMNIHRARIEARIRSASDEDVAEGINLDRLAFDTSRIPVPEGDGFSPGDVESFVDGFFDALDADQSFAEEAIAEDGHSAEIRADVTSPLGGPAETDSSVNLAQVTDTDTAAPEFDDWPTIDDDGISGLDENDEALINAVESADAEEYDEEPALDLSVLDNQETEKR